MPLSQTERNDAAIFDNGSDTGGIFPFRFLGLMLCQMVRGSKMLPCTKTSAV
jgi:hypothetical protein